MTKTASTDKNTGRKRGQGYKPKDRPINSLAPQHTTKRKLTANQWQNTIQQHTFMAAWITPGSPTFGNAYNSAIHAGYSPHYATKITAPTTLNEWIGEYRRKLEFTPEHITQGIQQLAIRANDSRSPDDTRLKAYETLARLHGMLDSKANTVNVTLVQPILGGTSVPDRRIVIDQQ